MITEILAKIVRYKNGVVVDSMRNSGIIYEINYGVPVVDIKRIAEQYFPNHKLAEQLFFCSERELKIAAVFIDNPIEINIEQIDKWRKLFVNTEITEKVCCHLFCKTPFAATKINEWIKSDNKFILQAAWNLFSKQTDVDFIKTFLQNADNFNFNFTNVQFAAIQALTSVSGNNADFIKNAVLSYSEILSKSKIS
ncbi:MAG: DNA alkylation repair protein, partial [Prevotellaceae bacterium]|nr:DNA alkylation repair protein [Prevotellaceae bacterium]